MKRQGRPGPPILDLPLPLVLALRYLKSTRRDALATFLSVVAAGSIALGVAALILALAMLSGFQRALKGEILARTPEIEVGLPAGADPEPFRRAALAVPGVRGAHLTAKGRGWLLSEGRVQAVEIHGFDGTVPRGFPGATGLPAGLYVSSSLAARWGLETGDKVEVSSPRPTLTPFGPQPRVRSLTLAGTFSSAATDETDRAALPLEVAASLLGGDRRALVVETGGLEAALAVAPRLAAALPQDDPAGPGPGAAGQVQVRTWQDLNRPLLFALALEKVLTFVAIALVILVAALALVADLSLLIASKRPEIGILQACGARGEAIRRAFLLLGGILGALGLAVGGAIGVGGAFVLDRERLLAVPGQVYFIDYVPFWVRPWDLAAVFGFTLAVSLACSLYAARRATLLSPVEAMRR